MRKGFTLIELLVVIGIIAVLISILLPAMGKLREQAATSACASNMRQIAMMSQLYANENRGYVPIGRASNLRWVNYWFCDNTDTPKPSFYMFGSLFAANLMSNGKVAYCPKQQAAGFEYNTADNPWPPAIFPVGISSQKTKSSYSMRPEYFVGFFNPNFPYQLPRIHSLQNKTILTDLVTHDRSRKQVGHREGLNRAMMDGSVIRVPLAATDSAGTSIQRHFVNLNPAFSTAVKNAAVDGIFNALDRF